MGKRVNLVPEFKIRLSKAWLEVIPVVLRRLIFLIGNRKLSERAIDTSWCKIKQKNYAQVVDARVLRCETLLYRCPLKAVGNMILLMPNIYYQINPTYEEKLFGKSIMQLPHFSTLANIDLFSLWMP